MLHDLDMYGLSADRGFLSAHESDEIVLPADFAEIEAAAARLPDLITTGRVRHWLDRLPVPAVDHFIAQASQAERMVAMVRYSFLTQAYVWAEGAPAHRLPANLAVPFVALADALGVPPVMTYAGYVLDNWCRIDKAGPIAFDNIMMDQHFAGGSDEAGFVLTHVAIEAAAGPALDLAVDLVRASENGDAWAVETMLSEIVTIWRSICGIFSSMTERCDPIFYFTRIRPYLNGWKDNPALKNGVIYEGVTRFAGAPQVFRGQTGSQSSIVPAMDALLGVGHAADPLRAYLDELHIYRPPAHRWFLDDVRAQSAVRGFVGRDGTKGLVDAYNAAVQAVADFRSLHLEYAASYINKQGGRSAGNDTEVGTGGTPFMKYLKKHRDETKANLLAI